jgi:hypothetical protein
VSSGPANAQGEAVGFAPAGGMVTVLQVAAGATTQDTITTVRGVQPGDDIRVGTPPSAIAAGSSSATMSASVPATASGTTPTFDFECGTAAVAGTTATFTFPSTCQPSTFDVLGIGVAPAGGSSFFYEPSLTFASGSSFALTQTWQPVGASTVTITNGPADLAAIDAAVTIFVGELPFPIEHESIASPAAGSATVALHDTMSVVALRASLAVTQLAGTGAGVPVDEVVKFATADVIAMDQTLDATTLPVQTPTGVAQSADGATWTATGSGGDVRLVSWRASFGSHQALWNVVEPADDAVSSTLPGLPAAYASDDPTATTATLGGATVSYLAFTNLLNYEVARASAGAVVDYALGVSGDDHTVHASIGTSP